MGPPFCIGPVAKVYILFIKFRITGSRQNRLSSEKGAYMPFLYPYKKMCHSYIAQNEINFKRLEIILRHIKHFQIKLLDIPYSLVP